MIQKATITITGEEGSDAVHIVGEFDPAIDTDKEATAVAIVVYTMLAAAKSTGTEEV